MPTAARSRRRAGCWSRRCSLEDAAAADGTHFEIYEDNLLTGHHIRYGKRAEIAYRHIADQHRVLRAGAAAVGAKRKLVALNRDRNSP